MSQSGHRSVEIRCIGPYRLLDRLGCGAYAEVYRAEHAATAEQVALKAVRSPAQEPLAALRREIQLLSRIRHPGIARIVDHGVEAGLPWYAMELVQGLGLREYGQALWPANLVPLAGERRLRIPAPALHDLLTLIRRLCSPLGFLHGEGIVHRDLKPGNILIRDDGTPVLLDFAFAWRFSGAAGREALEIGSPVAGSYAYMAPELLRGELPAARADLYALGCILYELLTGRPVYATLQQVLDPACPPRLPSELLDGIPQALDAVLLRLLEKQPAERLGHAMDLAAELEGLGAARETACGTGPAQRDYLYSARLAGRGAALRALGRCLDRLEQGWGGALFIAGESGAGKTRLCIELARQASERGIRVIGVEGSPLAAQPEAAPSLLGSAQTIGGLLQALADECRELGPAETGRLLGHRGGVLALYQPALASLSGLRAAPRPAELEPAAARLRLYTYLAEVLAALTEPMPVVLILDDLQWADELSLGFLDFLIRGGRLRALRLLVAGSYRTGEAGPGLRRVLQCPRSRHLQLERLAERAVGRMLADMLALKRPARSLIRFLSRQSEGNPFFVAEYLRTAVAERLLHRDGQGRWRLAGPGRTGMASNVAALPQPASLRELVGRHLDGLGAGAGRLAEAAAVLGREAELAALESVAGLNSAQTLEALGELLARQVLEWYEPVWLQRPPRRSGGRHPASRAAPLEAPAGGMSVRFVHDLLREVAYERIAPERRRTLHRAAAEAVEARLGPEPQEHLALLGSHWEFAGVPDRARQYYLAAARHEALRHVPEEADRLYRAYFALMDRPTPQSIAAHNEWGEQVLSVLGRTAEARREHSAALEEARRHGEPAAENHALRCLARLAYQGGRIERAVELYEQALAGYRTSADRRGEAQTLLGVGWIYMQRGETSRARKLLQRAQSMAGEADDLPLAARSFGTLAALERKTGRRQSALCQLRMVRALARKLGDRRLEAVTTSNLANLHQEGGRFALAGRLHEQARSIACEIGDRPLEASILNNLALFHGSRSRPQQARRLLRRALAINREIDARRSVGDNLRNLALISFDEGRVPEAQALLEEALAIQREVGDRRFEGYALMLLARIDRLAGRLSAAVERIGQAEAVLQGLGYAYDLAYCLCEKRHQRLALQRPATEVLEACERLLATLGLLPSSELCKYYDELRRAQQDFEAGRPLFQGERLESLSERVRRWLAETGQMSP